MSLLEAQRLRFGYDSRREVVRGVDLPVEEGGLSGLVGPNGSGKSTLLRLLAGILEPREGTVLLEGKAIRRWPRREVARRVGFLPQELRSAFDFSCREVVALGRYPHQGLLGLASEGDQAAIVEAMALTCTEHLAERPFSDLSGGERQRVLIASVLAQEPRILLLDEPTSALDIHHRVEVLTLLRRLAGPGRAVLVVTHDLNLAAQFCSRLFLLAEGQLAGSGTPDEVLRQELLEEVYQARVAVTRHPLVDAPLVVPLAGPAGEDR